MRLAGRTAIVTGAGSGIGRASAVLFAKEGAFVALVDRDGAGSQVFTQEPLRDHPAEGVADQERLDRQTLDDGRVVRDDVVVGVAISHQRRTCSRPTHSWRSGRWPTVTGPKWSVLLRELDSAGLADHGHLDLARVLELLLDLSRDRHAEFSQLG